MAMGMYERRALNVEWHGIESQAAQLAGMVTAGS